MTFFPTNHYPGIYWPGSRQVEAGLPVTAAPPFFDQLTADNIAASGIRETIVLRSEERRQLTFFGLDALETAQWGQYFNERGGRGQQAELLVDRFTGRAFTFANTTADQNLDGPTSGTVTSYQVVNEKIGFVAAQSSGLHFAINPTSVNALLINSQGTIVMTVLCSFAGNDGVSRTFFVWGGNAVAAPKLRAQKTAANALVLRLDSDAQAAYNAQVTGINWPSGTVISLVCQWTIPHSLGLWLTVPGSGTTQVTVSLSGVAYARQESLFAFASETTNNEGFGRGVLLYAATYRRAYDNPTVLLSHFPLGRNYYSRAELVERTFNPARIAPGVDAWQWTWTFRQGF